MAHLIRMISGTNREPVYGLWRVCELCPDAAEDPGESEWLQEIVNITDQEPGMTLRDFWYAFAGSLLAAEASRLARD